MKSLLEFPMKSRWHFAITATTLVLLLLGIVALIGGAFSDPPTSSDEAEAIDETVVLMDAFEQEEWPQPEQSPVCADLVVQGEYDSAVCTETCLEVSAGGTFSRIGYGPHPAAWSFQSDAECQISETLMCSHPGGEFTVTKGDN